MIDERPYRYCFDISGHIEVIAHSLEEAKELVGTKSITYLEKETGRFIIAIPIASRLIHSEPINQ